MTDKEHNDRVNSSVVTIGRELIALGKVLIKTEQDAKALDTLSLNLKIYATLANSLSDILKATGE